MYVSYLILNTYLENIINALTRVFGTHRANLTNNRILYLYLCVMYPIIFYNIPRIYILISYYRRIDCYLFIYTYPFNYFEIILFITGFVYYKHLSILNLCLPIYAIQSCICLNSYACQRIVCLLAAPAYFVVFHSSCFQIKYLVIKNYQSCILSLHTYMSTYRTMEQLLYCQWMFRIIYLKWTVQS